MAAHHTAPPSTGAAACSYSAPGVAASLSLPSSSPSTARADRSSISCDCSFSPNLRSTPTPCTQHTRNTPKSHLQRLAGFCRYDVHRCAQPTTMQGAYLHASLLDRAARRYHKADQARCVSLQVLPFPQYRPAHLVIASMSQLQLPQYVSLLQCGSQALRGHKVNSNLEGSNSRQQRRHAARLWEAAGWSKLRCTT
jgi:hypothetical protein